MANWSVPLEWEGEAAFIIGGGPSIRDLDFERLRGKARTIAVNTAYKRAPWADVLFWSDKRWLDWNHADLHEFRGQYMVSRKTPHLPTPRPVKVLDYYPNRFAYESTAVGGWCSGSSAINLAYHFGARVIILLGFDMKTNGNWHDLHKLPAEPDQHRIKFIPAIERMAPHLRNANVIVLNTCAESGLRCFPFADLEELLAMDNLAKIEAAKYQRIWERPEYRRVSPGMMEVERAQTICEFQPGQSLIDFGSGPARATKWFQDRGMDVLAIDFADNARETDVPYIRACLWDLPDTVPTVDHGYCCDVMEHIPPMKVDAVLREIAGHVRNGCYFRIATRPDRMGKLIGMPLHLTVMNGDWWRVKLSEHFAIVDVIEDNKRDLIVWARHSAKFA